MFLSTNLFLETTNPNLTWKEFIKKNIIYSIFLSILVNTTVYTIILNLTSYVFLGKILNNKINIRLIMVLFIIMIFGYIGRIMHSKEVYKAFHGDEKQTRNFLNQHYNSWIFLG
jgi:uncharacterized membrane protein